MPKPPPDYDAKLEQALRAVLAFLEKDSLIDQETDLLLRVERSLVERTLSRLIDEQRDCMSPLRLDDYMGEDEASLLKPMLEREEA